MPKNGTASPTTGRYADFQAVILKALPLPGEIKPDVVLSWMLNTDVLARALRETLKELPQSYTSGSFMVTCTGSNKTYDLAVQGNYNHWPTQRITNERFPLRKHALVERHIELVGFDYAPSLKEVLAEFIRRNLERPTYEDALYFGIQHPEEQRKHPIIFPYKTRQEYILVLSGGSHARYLGESRASNETRWNRSCVFAAIRSKLV